MNIRDTLEHCLEVAPIPNQPWSIREQFKRDAKTHKVTASLRLFPSFLLRGAYDLLRSDTLPINPAIGVDKGCMYGCESVGYCYEQNGRPMVLKKFRSFKTIEERVDHHRKYADCFGPLVAKTSFMVVENPLHRHQPIAMSVQPKIEGSDLFVSPNFASVQDLVQLQIGVETMQRLYGRAPDFGPGNVLINQEGTIQIVDTGGLFTDDEVHERPDVEANLGWLHNQVAITPVYATAS